MFIDILLVLDQFVTPPPSLGTCEGLGHLSRFQDLETTTPVILTTSQLLTTGIDAPACKNVVLARVVNSMAEFKQIIGCGTRVRDDYGKYSFNLLDYTGSAARQFADPAFDREPVAQVEEKIDETGARVSPMPVDVEPEAAGFVEEPEECEGEILVDEGGVQRQAQPPAHRLLDTAVLCRHKKRGSAGRLQRKLGPGRMLAMSCIHGRCHAQMATLVSGHISSSARDSRRRSRCWTRTRR